MASAACSKVMQRMPRRDIRSTIFALVAVSREMKNTSGSVETRSDFGARVDAVVLRPGCGDAGAPELAEGVGAGVGAGVG